MLLKELLSLAGANSPRAGLSVDEVEARNGAVMGTPKKFGCLLSAKTGDRRETLCLRRR
jgi:hypothetical protein